MKRRGTRGEALAPLANFTGLHYKFRYEPDNNYQTYHVLSKLYEFPSDFDVAFYFPVHLSHIGPSFLRHKSPYISGLSKVAAGMSFPWQLPISTPQIRDSCL